MTQLRGLKVAGFLLLPVLWSSGSFAQTKDITAYITFFGLEKMVAHYKRMCVSVKVPQEGDTIFSSGFLVNTKRYVFAVTSNHGVPEDSAIVSVNVEGGKREEIIGTVVARSPGKDAVVLLVDLPRKRPDVLTLGLSAFDTADTPNSPLREGAGVVFLGFPLRRGLAAPEQGRLSPVCRMGIVASRDPGSIWFLIDGFASHGNSGSPVFSVNGSLLVGMLSSVKSDHIKLYDERGESAVSLPYNSGLAEAITAQALVDLIRLGEVNSDDLIKKVSGQLKAPSK
jgi:S1-C subfamily serine protease